MPCQTCSNPYHHVLVCVMLSISLLGSLRIPHRLGKHTYAYYLIKILQSKENTKASICKQ